MKLSKRLKRCEIMICGAVLFNRAYYAMFYAVLALAALKDIAISKHTHAVAFFDKEFVHKGIFPKELSRALHYGFD